MLLDMGPRGYHLATPEEEEEEQEQEQEEEKDVTTVGARKNGDVIEFLVQWKDYRDNDKTKCTFLPESELAGPFDVYNMNLMQVPEEADMYGRGLGLPTNILLVQVECLSMGKSGKMGKWRVVEVVSDAVVIMQPCSVPIQASKKRTETFVKVNLRTLETHGSLLGRGACNVTEWNVEGYDEESPART